MDLYSKDDVLRLAEFIFVDCVKLDVGDCVIVEGIDVSSETLILFKKVALKFGFKPILLFKSNSILIENSNLEDESLVDLQAKYELGLMRKAKAFIGLREPRNLYELGNLTDQARSITLNRFIRPVHFNYRNNKLQWLYFRLPTEVQFKRASRRAQEKLVSSYFKSVFISPTVFSTAIDPLAKRLEGTKQVRILAKQTDICFELSSTGVYKSVGSHNLPDGEIFVSPKRTGVNGVVNFNVPSTYLGRYFENIALTFECGKVVKMVADRDLNFLDQILDIDDGSRYCGELALGLNPYIEAPINDILYDEKMHGSFHLALGNSYPEADNGNRSTIHWDLIQDMKSTEAKVFFDDDLVMDCGKFVSDDLIGLNLDPLKNRLLR
ncbi:MAG: aminopeptidase [Cyclobacteriaceae bacterium]